MEPKTPAHSPVPNRTCVATSIELMAMQTTSAFRAPVTATTGQGSTSSLDVQVKTGTRGADAVRCGTFAVRLIFRSFFRESLTVNAGSSVRIHPRHTL
jgi:hypothetical protein